MTIRFGPRILRLKANSAKLKNPSFMKSRPGLLLAIPPLIAILAVTPATTRAKSDTEQICVSVGRLLEEGHYTHQPLNDEMSRNSCGPISRCSISAISFSPSRMSTRSPRNTAPSLDDDILLGNLKPAYEIYAVFTQSGSTSASPRSRSCSSSRWISRTTARIELSRQKAPWPKDEAEADQLWRAESRTSCSRNI